MGIKSENVYTSHYGKIFIYTEKETYTAGDSAHGAINLNLIKAFPGDTLAIQLLGKEKVHWEYVDNTDGIQYTYYHNGKARFFSHALRVHKFPNGMAPAGQYNFPFSFQTKPNLPSSFEYGTEAQVYYKLKVILKNSSNITAQNMQFQQRVTIQSNLKGFPQTQDKTGENKVITCCCQHHGRGSVTCKLEKNAFYANETIRLSTFVDNKSKIDFKNLRVECGRNIIQSPDRIPNAQSKQILIELTNPFGLPSYIGKLIQVAYEIKVQAIPDGCLCLDSEGAQCCCGSFPHVTFPVIICYENIPESNFVMPAMYNQYLAQVKWNPQQFSPVHFQFNDAMFQRFQDTTSAQMQQQGGGVQQQNQIQQLQAMQSPMQGQQYITVNSEQNQWQNNSNQQPYAGYNNQINQINVEMLQKQQYKLQ